MPQNLDLEIRNELERSGECSPRSVKPPDYSDAGNAAVFTERYSGELIYVDALGWLWWSGKRWERNEHRAVEMAVTLTEDMLSEAKGELSEALRSEAELKLYAAEDKSDEIKDALKEAKEDAERAKKYLSHAVRSRNAARVKGMLDLAKHELVLSARELDVDPLLLNTPDGMIRLETGELLPHDPAAHCTHITEAAPGQTGEEMWTEFLDSVTCNDASLAGYLQLVAGMMAIGKVYHEGIVIAYGGGGNGKSTLFNTIRAVLGDYAGMIDPAVLTTDRQNKGAALATLRGRRMVIAAELEEHQRLSTSTLKKLASTDEITIEEKYRAPEDIKPSHTLILYTNFLPRVGSTDNGTWNRLAVVPFLAKFRGERKEVKNYSEVLAREAGPAVLAWIVEGAKNFARNRFRLDIPDAVAEATEEYRARENWLENFIAERCVKGAELRTGARELYTEYRKWADENGEFRRRESDFAAAMLGAGFEKIAPKNRKTWVGLGIAYPD